ncbi:MAG TPA: trypsin-like peptidase domain-containing protein, partial [Candidatus Methylomirabilis sp.]|nr:trypsin-like peptidase domain-containing protein [Candidatus Methylomirabilis sp.]
MVNIHVIIGGAQAGEALGSGFVWDKQGHIVTNNHVVESATSVDVIFSDGLTVPAKVVGTDPDADLAVIQVSVPADRLPPVTLADSTKVKIGQLAVAIGNPFGQEGSMSVGFVSGLGRELPVNANNPLSSNTGSYIIPDIIQTDAPINPGNSGGVLVDDQGHVLGVTAAIATNSGSGSGVGFVIPSVIVQKVVPSLIKNGSYQHPYIGISGTTMTPELAQPMGLNSDQRGALVVSVTAGGPAANAGLQASNNTTTVNGQQEPVGGDVIVSIDGNPVKTFDDLITYLARNTDVG